MKILYYLALYVVSALLSAEEGVFWDYNFDGHEDRRIWRESDGRLGYYDIYLYSEKTKSFEKHAVLSGLHNPIPNQETRQIECFWPGGHAGMIYRMQLYAWDGDELSLEKAITQDHIKVGEVWEYIKVTVVVADGMPRIELIEHIEPGIK